MAKVVDSHVDLESIFGHRWWHVQDATVAHQNVKAVVRELVGCGLDRRKRGKVHLDEGHLKTGVAGLELANEVVRGTGIATGEVDMGGSVPGEGMNRSLSKTSSTYLIKL